MQLAGRYPVDFPIQTRCFYVTRDCARSDEKVSLQRQKVARQDHNFGRQNVRHLPQHPFREHVEQDPH